MGIERLGRGFVFWPVGNGDSTTIILDEHTVLQIDLNQVDEEDEQNPRVSIVDELIEVLDTGDGEVPLLAAFALTHPDQDHCRGFPDLLERVEIGELWFTPRIFREYGQDLCDDAAAFRDEAFRRVRATIDGDGRVDVGDRVRLVGYDELLKEDEFAGFPRDMLTVPGNEITEVDGTDRSDLFRAFVHAPFKDDSAAEDRNATSLGLQVTLQDGGCTIRTMLLGDLPAATIKRIFCEATDDPANLAWDAYLAPHHCSKTSLYVRDADTGASQLDRELLSALEDNAEPGAYIIASSNPFRDRDKDGDDPPHLLAREAYESIIDAGHFLATSEHGEGPMPEPIRMVVEDGRCGYQGSRGEGAGTAAVMGAVAGARGSRRPPAEPQGFGSQ